MPAAKRTKSIMLFDVIRRGWGVVEEGSFGKVKIFNL